MTQAKRERFMELISDRALFKLDAEQQIELAELYTVLGEKPGGPEERALEGAAASLFLANLDAMEPMPADLADKILARAGMTVSRRDESISAPTEVDTGPRVQQTMVLESARPQPQQQSGPPAAMAPASMPPASMPPMASTGPRRLEAVSGAAQQAPMSRPSPSASRTSTGARVVALFGWVAAAACLMIAIYAWKTRANTIGAVATSASSERASLLAHAGTHALAWTATADPAATHAEGDVVWNEQEQRGYMRFHGLAKNDPKATQYQLWIFDKSRDDKFPVDGGVFNVTSEDGDVIVPIHAALAVGGATLFAVTVEKPGGVVVSKRERIVVTAKTTS